MRRFGQHDRCLGVLAEVVERGHEGPAVHLCLVDLLGAVIQPRGIAKTDGIGRREQAEIRVRRDDLVLIKQGQLAVMFQNALDHEHHIGAARVIFVENDGDRVAQRPWQNAFVEFGHLLAVAQFDRVLTDQVDPRNMAVEVHTYRGPVQTGRDLFDMGGFTRAVVALNHHAAVM